mmetsp:Transcript_15915/g.53246  ORF Transcript_15915/g.53246 Transcript_15915/m.53246 type:complete len:578 (-) Transcript_15915:224-1957(-)
MAQPQNVSAKSVEVKNNLTQRHPNDFMSIMQQPTFQLLNGIPSMLNGIQLPGLQNDIINLLKPRGNAQLSPQELRKGFDFWTEEENTRFVNAIDSQKFPPDFSILAAKVGNKTVEQCQSYARFYFEALKHFRKLPPAPGKGNLHIKAADVYNFLGIGMAYKEFLSTQNSSSPLKTLTTSFVPSTPSLSSFTDGFSISKPKVEQETQSSSKGSIDFLCSSSDVPCEPLSMSNVYQGPTSIPSMSDPNSRNVKPGANKNMMSPKNDVWTWPASTTPQASNRGAKPYNGNHLPALSSSQMQPSSDEYTIKKEEGVSNSSTDAMGQHDFNEADADARAMAEDRKEILDNGDSTWPSSEAGLMDDDASKPMAIKRRRPESPTREKEREIDKNRINKRDMWTYACMQQAPATKEEKEAQEKEENILDVKNPWDWTRKLIIKSSGYSNWWPHFIEYVILSKREVGDDIRTIRDKAPPPPESKSERRGDDRETKRPRKDAPVHEWVYNGCMVEVKWEGDWWHAKVKKMKPPKGGEGLEKLYVTYVGGTEDEDEWVPISKVRAPREDVDEKLLKNKRRSSGNSRRK